MRYMIPAFAVLALAGAPVSGFAQSPSGAPAPSVTSPAQPGPTIAPTPKPARQTRLDKRFSAANTTNDGHLTLDQAKAAKWTMVVRHFAAIDVDKKGYVTQQDIQAASAAARATKAAKSTTQKS